MGVSQRGTASSQELALSPAVVISTHLHNQLAALHQRDVLSYTLSGTPAPCKQEMVHLLDLLTVSQPSVRFPVHRILSEDTFVTIDDRSRRTYGGPFRDDTSIFQYYTSAANRLGKDRWNAGE